MNELEDKDNEEYKKRIKELIENIEKTKDKDSKYTEQDLIEDKDGLLQTIKRKTQEDKFRSERIIVVLTYWIKSYYKKRMEKGQFQEEIDELYELIYKQFRKPSSHISNLDSRNPNLDIFYLDSRGLNPEEKADKFRIFEKMLWVLGVENVEKDFSRKYKYVHFGFEDVSFKKELIQCSLVVIILIIVIILVISGYDFSPF